VYPGTFDPPTIAHLAIAEAAVARAALDRLDFALSRVALGKEDREQLDERRAALERLIADRPELGVVVTDAQLIADIARGYDVVVMGADKWAQVNDPDWYESVAARDLAVAALPRVFVVPRGNHQVSGAEVLDIDPALAEVSSSAVRAGADHFRAAPGARIPVRARVIVDGNNVIGSRPDGWWRDRPGAARRLIASLQARARTGGERIAVVLDGRPLPDHPEGVHDGVLVAYARRAGRDAADDRIVEEVTRDRDPSTLTVVTSDRGLRDRVRELGAHVESASWAFSDSVSEPFSDPEAGSR
jgi:nicotinic acid mononucleotide adenylyltransferase/predicted RNA-binding protein with PIN domain